MRLYPLLLALVACAPDSTEVVGSTCSLLDRCTLPGMTNPAAARCSTLGQFLFSIAPECGDIRRGRSAECVRELQFATCPESGRPAWPEACAETCTNDVIAALLVATDSESCFDDADSDGDGRVGCADYDCLPLCPQCAEDAFAPNHTPETAASLEGPVDGVTHVQRPDLWTVSLPALTVQPVRLDTEIPGLISLLQVDTLDVAARDTDDDGYVVHLANRTSSATTQTFQLLPAGLDAEHPCRSYALTLLDPVPLEPEVCDDGVDNDLDRFADCQDLDCGCGCEPDAHEPNDTIADAAPGPLGRTELTLHVQSPDVFWYSVGPAERLVVGVLTGPDLLPAVRLDTPSGPVDAAFGEAATGLTWLNVGPDPATVSLTLRATSTTADASCADTVLDVSVEGS